ncbi:MAG: hypothetical protein QG589_521 [Patescibacteria group bacterium]|nr:hypothetical protein [Patescibacteria group bacterium]
MSKDARFEPVKYLRTKDGRFASPKGPWINVANFTPEAVQRIHDRIAKMKVEKPNVPPLFNGLIPSLRGRIHR